VLRAAPEAALARPSRIVQHIMETVDATLAIVGGDERELADVPAERITLRQRGRAPILETHLRRAAAQELRWAVALHPTEEDAREAGMAPAAFADLVYAAAFCDRDDPVAAWERQGEQQRRLLEVVAAGSEVRLQGPGTDLRLTIAGRTWRSSDAARNLPDGEVFTGPHEGSAEGTVAFTYPGLRNGRRIEGIRLRFAAGEVVEASSADEEDSLRAVLDTDDGARRLGEIGIGTNFRLDRFTANTLLDEKIGGTFHLALGRSYPETGGTNVSAVHWDLVCDLRHGGSIEVDGRTIQRDGRFAADLDLDFPV
jgi:aminopeptidase